MGRLWMRDWARGRTQSSLLNFLPEWSGGRLTMTNVMAGPFKTDDSSVSVTQWKQGLSCVHSSVSTREFSSDDVGRRRKKLMPLQERNMIDKFRLHVRGGDGGAGCSSFRKGRQSRYGSADGGNGGFGGDVILVSSAAVWDLSNLQHHLSGASGGQGSSKKKVGSRGKDKTVQVPVGTVIHIVRGSIPFLEDALPSKEEPTWEQWEDVSSDEENNHTFDELQCETSSSTEREKFGMNCLPPPGLKRKCVQDPSARSRQDSMLLVPCLDFYEQGVLEGSGHISVSQLPGSSSDADTGMSSESSDDEYDFNGTSDKEDDDVRLRQDLRSSVAEFIKVGQSLIVARGGVGGKGNAAMARGRGSDKSLPSFQHELGQLGSEADLILELKTIADVGLVGAPNAGKSTLLGSLSNAKPISGHYKFTTLRPNIGMVEFEDFFSLTVADIPGLIEGAHMNRGLGHGFLRHIERTKVLAYVLDLAGGIGDDLGPLPWDQFEELVFELELYQKGLSQRPSIVIANKIDEEGVLVALEVLRKKVPYLEIYGVCAVLDEGIEELKKALRRLVESSRANSQSLQLSDSIV